MTKNNLLSVTLLLGIFFQKTPLRLLQPFLDQSIKLMQDKHPGIFERLANKDFDFTVDAIDLPFIFYLKPSQVNPVLKAIKRTEQPQTSATIRGSLSNLLNLFEGNVDGDALFFSKELVIEGLTEATVALRNAVDGESMSIINDLSDMFSPFNNIAKTFALSSIKKYTSLQKNLNTITSALLYNTNKDYSYLKNRVLKTEEDIANITARLNKLDREKIRKKSDYNDKPNVKRSSIIQ